MSGKNPGNKKEKKPYLLTNLESTTLLIKIKGGAFLHTWVSPGNVGVLQRPKEMNISKSQGLEKLMHKRKKKPNILLPNVKYIKYPQCQEHVPCTGGQRKREKKNQIKLSQIK